MPYKDRQRQLAHQRASVKRRREHNIRVLNEEYKSDGCQICGEREYVTLGFHHLNPSEKDFVIGNHLSYSLDRLRAEAEKCTVLCHNCHAKLHYGLVDLPAA